MRSCGDGMKRKMKESGLRDRKGIEKGRPGNRESRIGGRYGERVRDIGNCRGEFREGRKES
jgi:hypothetical protein